MTTHTTFRALGLLLAASALGACGAPDAGEGDDDTSTASKSEALSKHCAPDVDPSIAVPSGNRLAFSFGAVGVQIYECQATGWVFLAPEADLLRHKRVVGSHYAGPTWEYRDGSTAVGTKLAAYTADPTAVPWLLLQASPGGSEGLMSGVTYIQRIDTIGGIAPVASESTADSIGNIARVDYTANYAFFEAGSPPACCH